MPIFPTHPPASVQQTQATLESGRGLTVISDGIPVLKGSGFEFYEPGWKKGYYSSKYHQQTVKKLADGSTLMTFASDDGLASGSESLRQDGSSLTIDYVFNWNGPSPAKVEVTLGNLWAPVFRDGKLTSDSTETGVEPRTFKSKVEVAERQFTPDSSRFVMNSGLGRFEVKTDAPVTLFDARDYEWADSEGLFWLGAQGLDVSAGHPAKLHCVFRIDIKAPTGGAPVVRELLPHLTDSMVMPNEELPVLIPKPKEANLHFDQPVLIPAGLGVKRNPDLAELLNDALNRRFTSRSTDPLTSHFPVTVSTEQKLNPGSYRLNIQATEINILARDDEGKYQAIERLASLAFAKNGKLWLPTGEIDDEPGIAWRGVHLFVGPTATEFHKKLWDCFLKPLGFNHVVLQCERTSWKTLPGIDTSITMKREDLVQLFKYYRSIGVDPIPLVQSFGHAEWMFAYGKNLDLALNPDVPYAVDPRKPRTREVLTALWDEIISNLEPKTVHFGLDEVDMRGWKPDPKFVTEMWKLHIPFLTSLAEKHKVQMMLWGDKCLAPSEAIDAAMGDDATEAAARRSVVPKGALIGDWHYAGNPDPAKFETSLNVWKASGHRPVASAWFNPQNLRSFFDAAKSTSSEGVLITTWAGYESSEETMLAALKQYAAMAIAADYAWSPRPDPISSLPYDPMQVLKRMYFDEPSRTSPIPGIEFSDRTATDLRVGNVNFKNFQQPIRAVSILEPKGADSASEIKLYLNGRGQKLYLALSTDQVVDEGKVIAKVEIGFEGSNFKTYDVKYGLQVRAESQKGVCVLADRANGISAVGLAIPEGKVVRYCRITQIDRLSGLNVHGVSLSAH